MHASTSDRGPAGTPPAGPRPRRPGARFAAWLLLVLLPCAATAADAGAPADPGLRPAIASALVRPDGAGFARHRWEREPAVVALYFGAGWCGPCHAFVPTLRELRDALREAGADTEVVYASLDATEADMHRYMRRQAMPWPAIDHRRLRALPAIRALGGLAPPNLVLIDRDGKVLASSWEGRRYRGLQPVLDAWLRTSAAAAHAGPPDPAIPSIEDTAR